MEFRLCAVTKIVDARSQLVQYVVVRLCLEDKNEHHIVLDLLHSLPQHVTSIDEIVKLPQLVYQWARNADENLVVRIARLVVCVYQDKQ